MKTKKVKTIISLLLVITLIASIISICDFSASAVYNVPVISKDGLWKYKIFESTNEYTIMDYFGNETDITLPETIDGHPIKGLSMSCEEGSIEGNTKEIKNLTIPKSYIYFYGIDNMPNLKTVTFSREYKQGEIKKFGNPGRWFFYKDKALEKVILPNLLPTEDGEYHSEAKEDIDRACGNGEGGWYNNAVIIPDHCFASCKKLKEVTLPNNLTEVEAYAFDECSSLESLELPEGLLYTYAIFDNCTSLKSVKIPSTLINVRATIEGAARDSHTCQFITEYPNPALDEAVRECIEEFKNDYGIDLSISVVVGNPATPSESDNTSSTESTDNTNPTDFTKDSNTTEPTSEPTTENTEPSVTEPPTTPTNNTDETEPATTEQEGHDFPFLFIDVPTTKIYVGQKVKLNTMAVINEIEIYEPNVIEFKSSNTKVATVSSNGIVKGKKSGTVTITGKIKGVSAPYDENASDSVRIKIIKRNNPIKVTAKTIKAKSNKKTVFKKSKAFTIKKAKGKLSFAKVSGNKKITVNKKTGSITVNKGLKKGKTYIVKIKVRDAGNTTYKAISKTVKIKVKIK